MVDGTELTSELKKIDQVRRKVGMVFQHFKLFPHLTIMENCMLAPICVTAGGAPNAGGSSTR
jgi:general L-amino acid transport system ATP-binding protein